MVEFKTSEKIAIATLIIVIFVIAYLLVSKWTCHNKKKHENHKKHDKKEDKKEERK
jgi:ABC-type nickel/cobalt efflux system permease component RcnA